MSRLIIALTICVAGHATTPGELSSAQRLEVGRIARAIVGRWPRPLRSKFIRRVTTTARATSGLAADDDSLMPEDLKARANEVGILLQKSFYLRDLGDDERVRRDLTAALDGAVRAQLMLAATSTSTPRQVWLAQRRANLLWWHVNHNYLSGRHSELTTFTFAHFVDYVRDIWPDSNRELCESLLRQPGGES